MFSKVAILGQRSLEVGGIRIPLFAEDREASSILRIRKSSSFEDSGDSWVKNVERNVVEFVFKKRTNDALRIIS